MLMTNVRNLNDYERLLHHAFAAQVFVFEKDMPITLKGLYGNSCICINKFLPSTTEKLCVLAEELGHHYTSSGNILDQSDIRNRKQELIARRWAHDCLIPLERLVEAACVLGQTNCYELAEYLNVTEEFLGDTLKYYESKYGTYVTVEGYTIHFSPLQVLELM